MIYNWVNDSKLIVENGMVGATGNIYVGLMEYKDMAFVLHYLNNSDIFYDIGANVGVYTVLSSKVKQAKTVSIEPLPNTYEKLMDNIKLNRIDEKVIPLNIGLSDKKSILYFTSDKDTMNQVATQEDKNTIQVDVDILDNVANIYGYPNFIKMDVEGYETMVLKGAEKVLQSKNLDGIIIELNGSGSKFGFNDEDIHNSLINNGFSPYDYDPVNRRINGLKKYGSHNTIYLKKDKIINIQERLLKSQPFKIFDMEI